MSQCGLGVSPSREATARIPRAVLGSPQGSQCTRKGLGVSPSRASGESSARIPRAVLGSPQVEQLTNPKGGEDQVWRAGMAPKMPTGKPLKRASPSYI